MMKFALGLTRTRHPNFASGTFAVLDKDTVKNKTCRIGYTNIDAEDGNKCLPLIFTHQNTPGNSHCKMQVDQLLRGSEPQRQ